MGTILNLTMSVAVLMAIVYILIFIHEGSHYLMNRRFGLQVKTLAVGWLPLIKFTRGNTEVQIGWLPLGGHNEIEGNTNLGLYGSTTPLGTVCITLVGLGANLLTAYLAFMGALLAAGAGLKSVADAAVACWYLSLGNMNSLLVSLHLIHHHTWGYSFPSIDQGGSLAYILAVGGYLSLAMAVFNFLPLPALDGGQCLVGLVQHVLRRAFPFKLTLALALASWAVVIAIFAIAVVPVYV